MIYIEPDYLKEFHCIAGKCRHTCCAGWEIDIDEDSLKRFQEDHLPQISLEGDPHFILQEGERCPYLREDNLCRLILEHGEDYLCQICRDHPRFRLFWTDIEETGLGLCCEEAARRILGREKPMELVAVDSETGETVSYEEILEGLPEDEQYLFELRHQMLLEARERTDPMEARLLEYLIYRQLPDALYDGLLEERICWIRESVEKVKHAWDADPSLPFEEKAEMARAFSEEEEYDPEALQEQLEKRSEKVSEDT